MNPAVTVYDSTDTPISRTLNYTIDYYLTKKSTDSNEYLRNLVAGLDKYADASVLYAASLAS